MTQKNTTHFDSLATDLTCYHASINSGEKFAHPKGEKYVVFCLGADFFAVSSGKVSEVVQMLAVTPIPNVPGWLLGIADLRGQIISVISLRKLLALPEPEIAPRIKFVVLKSPDFSSPIALAVDRLSEIVFLATEEIKPTEKPQNQYLLGKTSYNLNDLNLLNVENLFSSLTV